MLGKLTGEHEADGRLDLSGGESGLLVVGGELPGLGGDALKDVVDEGVHDGHALLGDSGVGVDLLEDLVDVRAVGSRCASSWYRRRPSWVPWRPSWLLSMVSWPFCLVWCGVKVNLSC